MSEITFSLGDTPAQPEHWPLRLAVVAEFIPRDFATGKPSTTAFRYTIDKDNFNETMAKMGMQLKFEIDNPFAAAPKRIPITIPLNVIKAFDPEHVWKAVPELQDVLAARTALTSLRFKKSTAEEVREQVRNLKVPPDLAEAITIALVPGRKLSREKPPPEKPQPQGQDDATVDKILDMVDTEESTPPDTESGERAKDALDEFLGKGKKRSDKLNPRAIQNAIGQADALINTTLDQIMHHSEFQRLERVWRGLKFLIDRTNFRKNITIEIIHASRENLKDVFETYLHKPEFDATTDTPLAAAVLAFEFSHDTPDIELLRKLGHQAAQVPFVVLGAIDKAFLGIERTDQFPALPSITRHLESAEHTKYRGLRDEESSRWLGLAFNRFLLRAPHGQDQDTAQQYVYHESVTDNEELPWGNPVWAIAAQMTASQERIGWATEVGGKRLGTMVDNLPVHARSLPNGEQSMQPLEHLLPEARIKEFAKCGIMPLVCDRNTDMVYLLLAPTVRPPRHDPDPATADKYWMMASLSYQMYAGTIARFINRHYMEMVTGESADEIVQRVQQALAALNVTTGRDTQSGTVNVELSSDTEAGATPQLDISVRSPQPVMFGQATVNMALPLRH